MYVICMNVCVKSRVTNCTSTVCAASLRTSESTRTFFFFFCALYIHTSYCTCTSMLGISNTSPVSGAAVPTYLHYLPTYGSYSLLYYCICICNLHTSQEHMSKKKEPTDKTPTDSYIGRYISMFTYIQYRTAFISPGTSLF